MSVAKLSALFVRVDDNCFVCGECGLLTKDGHRLNSHIKEVHLKSVRFPCPFCEHDSARRHDLQLHIEKRHFNLMI